jgi:alpha-tubulin suppressor-like RCC1 family protein
MAITTASQSQIGQDTAKNSQIVTSSVKLVNSGGSVGVSGPDVSSIVVTDSGYNSLDDTAAATSNSYVRILGTGFTSTSNVFLNGTMVPKANVTLTSATELRVVLPVANTGNYTVGVFNSNTSGALYSNTFVISRMPQWITASPLANAVSNIAYSVSLSATSDSNITYSNTTTLPAGTTLLSNGYFYGTISVGATTTDTFTIKATDVQLQDTSKTFSLTTAIPATSGYLKTWGNNQYGQLGINNTTSYIQSPVQSGSLNNWIIVSAGQQWAHAIKNDNTLWAWGRNTGDGQLGDGGAINRSSPTQIGALNNWANITNGDRHTLAIKTDGTLWGWGRGDGGQLGLGDQSSFTSPKQVGALTTWSKISAGVADPLNASYSSSAAIKNDGTLWTWGVNRYGQLGLNSRSNYSNASPNQVGALTNWSDVDMSWHTVAVKTDGTLWAWGVNYAGQLGTNNLSYRSSPVQIGADTNWSKISVSPVFTLAIKIDGTLWAWGQNSSGQLGLGNQISKSSPTQVGTLTNWSSISGTKSTNSFALAIKNDGTLWAWGYGGTGQLGFGNSSNYFSPKQVGSGTNWVTADAGHVFSVAIQS